MLIMFLLSALLISHFIGALGFILYLKLLNKRLRWQIKNWERKEMDKANCCYENEKKANDLEIKVKTLESENQALRHLFSEKIQN